MSGICNYDNTWELLMPKWLRDNFENILNQSPEHLKTYKLNLYKKVLKLLNDSIEIDESKLESVLGELYFNTIVLLMLMNEVRTHNSKSKEMDGFFGDIDLIIKMERYHSSETRAREIEALAKKL